jgi:hypothetical protein
MPKNDLPNISAIAMPWCFDLTVNAELITSQAVMKARIAENPLQFDQLIREHGGVQFQAILKLEHQPRFYFWIPLISEGPGKWSAKTFLDKCNQIESEYSTLSRSWITWIEQNSSDLTKARAQHMNTRNKKLNAALRLVRPFREDDGFWALPYREQCQMFVSECGRLKPLIDFLR